MKEVLYCLIIITAVGYYFLYPDHRYNIKGHTTKGNGHFGQYKVDTRQIFENAEDQSWYNGHNGQWWGRV